MNRKGGAASASLVVLLAILGVTYRSRQGTESTFVQKPESPTPKPVLDSVSKTAEEASQRALKAIPQCQQIVRRLRRLYPDVPVPYSCFPEGVAPSIKRSAPASSKRRFMIALAANPVQTHLSLLFDRTVEAIGQALEDESYTYDSSWFPWGQTEKSSGFPSDHSRLEAELQEQPGIIVFRGGVSSPHLAVEKNTPKPYGEGLIVFVVAEQPTGGISDIQFEHALQWIQTLGCDPAEPLLVLGPTFSGSLPSLARELEASGIRPSPSASPVNAFQRYPGGIRIYSGSASSEESVGWFKKYLQRLGATGKSKPGAPFLFRTFYESDTLMTDRFLRYLQHQGYKLSKVAIVSEDETAFGKPSMRKAQHEGLENDLPVYLYYPRDIATLRSAYESQSIFSAGKQQVNTPTATLRGDLSEPASAEHDSVRTYAGQLTPLAQESVLFGITNILDSKHIEYVVVRSSNSLDQLFLSEFLRRSYPNGRVVLDGSDLLFRRGMQGASLRGVMLLSPYPLLSWTQDAIPKIHDHFGQYRHYGRSYRVFAEDGTEGVYIAARELVDPKGETAAVPIGDYAPPRWALKGSHDDRRPATWILVVGHRQFWPLAVLNGNTQPGIPVGQSLLEPAEAPQSDETSQAEQQNSFQIRLSLPGEMIGLLTFCLILGVWHVYCCWKGSIAGSPLVRVYFAPLPRLQHPMLIFLGSLIIGYLGIVLAFTMIHVVGNLAPISMVLASLTVLILLVGGFLACLTNYNLPILSPDVSDNESNRILLWRSRALWFWPLLLIVLTFLCHHFLMSRLDSSNIYPTFWRSVYLRSGVSPLLPRVLLLFGLYSWFWFGLQRLSLFGSDRPVLPRNTDLPEFDVPSELRAGIQSGEGQKIKAFRMFSREDAGDHIEAAALPLASSYLKSLAVLLPLTILAFCFALGGQFSLRSLGDRRFGTLISLFLSACIALILADSAQFFRTWSRLRQLLVCVDRLRLRRTLDAMKGLSWASVWKMSSNILEQRYHLISRQFESMGNLKNALDAWKPTAPEEIRARETALAQLRKCEAQGGRFAGWYVNLYNARNRQAVTDMMPLQEFQEELASTAGCVMTQLIVPAWHKETESLILNVGASGGASHDEGGNQQHTGHSADPVKPPVQAAEEFFLLPYVGFIQNAIARIRSIAMGILVLFVAATLGASSYPFDPLPVIGAIFVVVFAIVGTIVIIVYSEMHRDITLSRITKTRAGELGFEFWAKLFAFGFGPLIGLLTTLFPSITDFVLSWLQPGVQALK